MVAQIEWFLFFTWEIHHRPKSSHHICFQNGCSRSNSSVIIAMSSVPRKLWYIVRFKEHKAHLKMTFKISFNVLDGVGKKLSIKYTKVLKAFSHHIPWVACREFHIQSLSWAYSKRTVENGALVSSLVPFENTQSATVKWNPGSRPHLPCRLAVMSKATLVVYWLA